MKNKKKNIISSKLAKPKKQIFNFDLIAHYADYKIDESEVRLSEKTLIDLDFHDFFKYVDRTCSSVGQQFLFKKLICQTESIDKLESQEKLVNYYKSNKEKRLKSQLVLNKLAKPNDYYFPYLIFSELPKRMYKLSLIIALQIAIFLSIALSFKYPILFFMTILLFATNIGFHYLHKNRIGDFTVYFSRVTNLSKTLRSITPLSGLTEEEKIAISLDAKHIDQITSQVLFLKTDNLQNNEFGAVFWFIIELIKIVTLSEIVVFNRLVDKIRQSRPQIENVFETIGKVDVAISIGSLRDGLPYYSIQRQNKGNRVARLVSSFSL